MQSVVSALADKDPQAALALLQILPARPQSTIFTGRFSRWATTDPVAAAERAAQLPPGPDRDTPCR